MNDVRPVGLTKDAGWEIGVQRTAASSPDEVWRFLTSRRGIGLWLGEGARLGRERGDRYATRDGTTGELRSFHELDRIRLTWRPAGWDHDSTLQVAVRPRNDKTVIGFHQEGLAGPAERRQMRTHWKGVLDAIARELSSNRAPRAAAPAELRAAARLLPVTGWCSPGENSVSAE